MIGSKSSRSLFWLLQTSGWLISLALMLLYHLVRGLYTTRVLTHYLAAVTAGFLTTLLFRAIYKKIRIQDRSILWVSLLTLLFCFIGANLTVWLTDALKIPTWGLESMRNDPATAVYLRRVFWWLMPLAGWSALYIGLKFWQEWMIQKEEAEKARALTQTAQLQLLRYRMSPHFLFNTLNSIRALIAENRTSAKTLVTELSEYLRYSLVSKNYDNVPLRDEIESIRHYFNIQKIRYENKLEVSFNIEPEAEEFPILSFLLHPFAENAVKHGLHTSPLPLKVEISAGVRDGILRIDVINTGSWVEPSDQEKGPVTVRGLANVRQRLEDAYPGKHRLEILEREGTVRARLSIVTDLRR